MSTTYEFLASFAQTWGSIYFVALFIAVLAYALANMKDPLPR